MRFLALACDYDGTLAHDGTVPPETLDALRRLKESGRKVILVSGRQLPELREVFPAYDICDLIVAENGGLLFNPKTSTETLLAQPPPPAFAEELRRRGALPLAEGRVVVATWQPHETTVFQTIRDMGLELQVIFNKGAVMILPSGVNKASGLAAALKALELSPHNVVGVGDAENDHALLRMCEAGVAVANALPSLKEEADFVTPSRQGKGVAELIEDLLKNDLEQLAPRLQKHDLEIGNREDGTVVKVPPYGSGVLIAGTSGGGKSTLATGFIEQLMAKQYQYCILDPEGDYSELPNAVVLGNAHHAPSTEEVMTALRSPAQNCVVNLLGVSLGDRPAYFEKLFAQLMQLRTRRGRPHWLIMDETHHVFPTLRDQTVSMLPSHISGMLFITVDPAHIAPTILAGVDLILAIGQKPQETITNFCRGAGDVAPMLPNAQLQQGEALAWWRQPRGNPFVFRSFRPTLPRLRHVRKYAEGDVKDHAFVFTGPEGKLKLRAQNLFVFLQMGDGVDDITWNFHLRNGDDERWFREVIKDPKLAEFAASLASDMNLSADQTRKELRSKIEERYTAAS